MSLMEQLKDKMIAAITAMQILTMIGLVNTSLLLDAVEMI
jgi:hypothetical protein